MRSLIHHFLVDSAQKHPHKQAVGHSNEWMTYAELDDLSNRLGNFLRESGIARGERVILMFENSFDYIISYYAILKAGCIVVSLNTDTTVEMLSFYFNHSEASAVIASKKFNKFIIPALQASNVVRLIISDAPLPEGLEPRPMQRTAVLGEIYSNARDTVCSERRIDIDCSAIVYTSGSTGEPKGVMLSHLNTVSNTRSIIEYLQLTSDDRIMAVLPFYYVYGKTLLNTHVATGGSIVMDNRFAYPNVVLQSMQQQCVTGFAGVPSTFMILLHKSMLRQMTFPSLRYVTQAGGAMAPPIQREVLSVFSPVKVVVMYGATELAPRLTYVPPDRLQEKFGSIGIPIPNTDAFVADEKGQPLPPGREGELVARGSNVMMGYWKDSEGTAKVLRNGVYFTGDLGKADDDGFLYIIGRSNEMLKIGGKRVSALEIEEAILGIPGVLETAVIKVDDPVLGEAAKAFMVIDKKTSLSIESIKQDLLLKLPLYKVPKYIELRQTLPKNEAGKILKRKLHEPGNACP
jgi:long-chain acyl-CoA synthetase